MDKRKKPHSEEHKRKISEAIKKQHAEGRANSSGLFTKKAREKSRIARMGKKRPHVSGENHWYWKGEKASYAVKHIWLSRHYEKTGYCYFCKKYFGIKQSNGTQWANISGKYYRKREDYFELCRSCHISYDWTEEREKIRNEKISRSIIKWWKKKKLVI